MIIGHSAAIGEHREREARVKTAGRSASIKSPRTSSCSMTDGEDAYGLLLVEHAEIHDVRFDGQRTNGILDLPALTFDDRAMRKELEVFDGVEDATDHLGGVLRRVLADEVVKLL